MSGSKSGLLSICCLGYCHASYLSDAIKSICDIDYGQIEVIVVDDGSTDNSVDLLEALSEMAPFKIKVVAQKNTGNVGLNFNNAYKLASGDLIAFISLDDVYCSSVMLKQIELMNANLNLAFVASSKTVSIDDQGFVTDKADQLPLYGQEDCDIASLLELEYSDFGSFYIQSAIFRKTVIDAVGGFDEDMTGDDIVLRTKVFRYLLENPDYDFKVLRDKSFFYRLHGSNIHKDFSRQIKIVTEYLDRYWSERANPKILIDWACSYVSDNKFEKSVALFSINGRAANILSEPRIKSRLYAAVKKEISIWKRFLDFIYIRVKLDGGRRRVVLLGFLRFEYSRKKKPPTSKKGGVLTHYSECR